MEPFRIVVTGWGVLIQIQAQLATSGREAFVESLKRARECVDPLDCRGVLLDLRDAHLESDPLERVHAYVEITRFLGADRVAVAVASPPGAERIAEALDDAGMLEISRIIVPDTSEAALTPALHWVENGIEPAEPVAA